MPTSHALLAPSASKRWMTCAPSARAEAKCPDRESTFAKEGTLAHAVAELTLRQLLAEKVETLDEHTPATLAEDYWTKLSLIGEQCQELGVDFADMLSTVYTYYVTPVYEDYLEARAQHDDALLLVEAELNLSGFIPDGFGSSDAVLIYDSTLHVYDLKYGKGVKVEADHNTQMQCYALGALFGPGELYWITDVEMTILQPRLQHVSTARMTANALTAWGYNILRPAAARAYEGVGEYVAGDHCKFCKAAARCRANALRAQVLAESADKPELLSDEELADVLAKLDSVKNWATAVETYATQLVLSGHALPGWKVVEGRSLRKIGDQNAAIEALRANGFDDELFLKPRELRPISDLEKLLRKQGFQEILGGFVVKPQGKPTLAPESDRRPALTDAKDDFKDIID